MPSDDSHIPREYHSEYEDRPFQACTRCGESLADVADGYQIVKYWHNGETTYEYAICHACHEGLLREISNESRERLEKFHAEHFNARRGRERCAVCGCLDDEIPQQEFSRTAFVVGENLQTEILVCGQCTQRMQELMSEHTRGVWERFLAENFPTAPSGELPEPTILVKI